MNNLDKAKKFETLLTLALKVPGVRVNRAEFLEKELKGYVAEEKIYKAIKSNTIDAGIKLDILDEIGSTIINKRTNQTAGASFLAGLPGGFGMVAAVPADMLQYFVVSLKIIQELVYLYGYEDLWEENDFNYEKIRNELILFLGVMFGIGGATTAVRLISTKIAKETLKKLQRKAMYYPIIKKISILIGISITKDAFAKGISKTIPILGGIISGGATYLSMKPMGNRLKDTLSNSIDVSYTIFDLENDIKEFEKETGEGIEMEYMDKAKELPLTEEVSEVRENKLKYNKFNLTDELVKLKRILDDRIITEEEFIQIKKNLINRSI